MYMYTYFYWLSTNSYVCVQTIVCKGFMYTDDMVKVDLSYSFHTFSQLPKSRVSDPPKNGADQTPINIFSLGVAIVWGILENDVWIGFEMSL